MLAAELGAVPLQRCDQPGVLKHARMQLVRQVSDRLGEGDRLLLQTSHLLLRLSSLRRQPALEAAAGDAQGGKLLVDVVMQLAGDAGTLRFLGRDQPAGQALDLRVAVPQGILAGAQRFLGLLTLDDLGLERTLLPLEAADAPGVDAKRARHSAPAPARGTTRSPTTAA